jgi:hypothetical protein
MTDTARQARYRADAQALAAIGDHLANAKIAPVEVRLPRGLADAAVAAWEWDDEGQLDAEDLDQRTQRHRAGALALIGLSITQHGAADGDEIVVELSPELIGEAFIASDETPKRE